LLEPAWPFSRDFQTMNPPTDQPRVLVILSDIHAGSSKAVLPPGFVTVEGNEVKQNALQAWQWQCWLRMQDFVAARVGADQFGLVLNGDLVEGIHHGTKEIISSEVGDHATAAIQLLEPIAARAARVFVVRGTEAHVNNHEHTIAKKLGGVLNPELGIHAFDRLTLEVAGVRCVFRHHIGTTMRRGLAGSQLSLQLAEEQVEAANNGEPIPRVLACAHRHKGGVYKDDNGMCVITPAWQALTRFAHKVVSPARCKPGVIILDWRNCNEGDLPQVHEKYYAAPAPSVIRL
jgi:hypothetical protein